MASISEVIHLPEVILSLGNTERIRALDTDMRLDTSWTFAGWCSSDSNTPLVDQRDEAMQLSAGGRGQEEVSALDYRAHSSGEQDFEKAATDIGSKEEHKRVQSECAGNLSGDGISQKPASIR